MDYLWSLLVFPIAAPLFAEWWVRRSQQHAVFNRRQSDIQTSVPVEAVPLPTGEQQRQMRFISIKQFMAILTECSDLIVVDLRADARSNPFPIPTAFVLPVSPSEIAPVLEMLPVERSVAFCGASNLNIFMIITSSFMEGSAPLYFVEGDLWLAEVA